MNKEEKDLCGCNEDGCGCGGHDHAHDHDGCGCGCEGHDHDHDHDGCGCGCGCEDAEGFTVDLEDENGNIIQCDVIDGFEYKDNEYVLVQNPEDSSIYLFKVVGDDENGELVVPEDSEFDEVTKYYHEMMEKEQ